MKSSLFASLLLLSCSIPEPKQFAAEQGMSSAPAWGKNIADSIVFVTQPSFVQRRPVPLAKPRIPQRKDAAALFSSLTPLGGDAAQALLICKVTLPHMGGGLETNLGTINLDKRIDPVLEIESPDQEELRYVYGFNEEEIYLTIPLVSLKGGTTWKMEVHDQGRILSDELIGTLTGQYNAGVMTLKPKDDKPAGLVSECKAMAQADAEALFQKEVGEISPLAEQLKGTLASKIDLGATDKGAGASRLPEVSMKVQQLAALVGWQDPRVQEKVKLVDVLWVEWNDARKKMAPENP